jgi:hypothetical protein
MFYGVFGRTYNDERGILRSIFAAACAFLLPFALLLL